LKATIIYQKIIYLINNAKVLIQFSYF